MECFFKFRNLIYLTLNYTHQPQERDVLYSIISLLLLISFHHRGCRADGLQHMSDNGGGVAGVGMGGNMGCGHAFNGNPNSRCEEITIPMCRGIGYNMTSFPNEMNHETQDEAGLEEKKQTQRMHMLVSPTSHTPGEGSSTDAAATALSMVHELDCVKNRRRSKLRNTVQGPVLHKRKKEFAGIWITLWSGLCFCSTSNDTHHIHHRHRKFKYPERPIGFLSAWYFMVAVGYLSKNFLQNEEIACDGRLLKESSTGHILYPSFPYDLFLWHASSIWWVILSFTWFLAAGLKWGNEAITKHSQYFHLAAWLIPTLVLLLSAVDGDPILGICYVGNLNPDHLKTFVLAPLLCTCHRTTFLMAGFVSLFRIRSVIKQQGGVGAGVKADKLEKLMIRIGISRIGLSLCSNQGSWQKTIVFRFNVKILYGFGGGITSGVWILSGVCMNSFTFAYKYLRLCINKKKIFLAVFLTPLKKKNLNKKQKNKQEFLKQRPYLKNLVK
ncbi:Frizzled-2 [Lucilia cuprina]|nr:Frizzled-2 [Lucilia cuprina]